MATLTLSADEIRALLATRAEGKVELQALEAGRAVLKVKHGLLRKEVALEVLGCERGQLRVRLGLGLLDFLQVFIPKIQGVRDLNRGHYEIDTPALLAQALPGAFVSRVDIMPGGLELELQLAATPS